MEVPPLLNLTQQSWTLLDTLEIKRIFPRKVASTIVLDYINCLKDLYTWIELNAHKKVLSEASLVFAGMFESGMKEAIENKMEIPDFTFEIVEAAVKLCYGYHVSQNFSLQNIFLLCKFGDQYQIQFVINTAEEFLLKKLSPSNVCQVIQFAESINAKKLYEKCIEYLMKCSKETTPVYGVNVLDKDLLAEMFLNSLCPIANSVINSSTSGGWGFSHPKTAK